MRQGRDQLSDKLHVQAAAERKPDVRPEDYETGRFGAILRRVRAGATYEEICDYVQKRDGCRQLMSEGLYNVYVKIARGETSNISCGQKPFRSAGECAQRRLKMLELAAAGWSNAEIAKELKVSTRNVREMVGGDDRNYERARRY